MEFKKKLKTRLYIAIFYTIVGIVLMLINLFKPNEMLSSLGAIFFVMGIVRIVQYKRITKDEESIHRQEIFETDERNISLWTKARSMAFAVYIMLAAIAVIVFHILKMGFISTIVGLMMFAFIFIYWICYFIVRKKY